MTGRALSAQLREGRSAPEAWAAPLENFAEAMARRKPRPLAASTVDRIVAQVATFGRQVGGHPFDVTGAQVAGWLEMRTCSDRVLYG